MDRLHSSPFIKAVLVVMSVRPIEPSLKKHVIPMKYIKLFLMSAFVVTLSCCDNSSKTELKRTDADASRKAVKASNDSTLFVVLESVKGDSALVSNNETQRKYTLSVSDLVRDGENHGSLTINNTCAIMADLKKKVVYRSINLTEFAGLWMFSDKSGNGVRFDENGSASNIGQVDDITLRTWRIKNGRLMLSYVASDGSDYAEKEEEASLVMLSCEQLIFLFRGNQYTCYK